MNRQQMLRKIRHWLAELDMTPADIGVECALEEAPDECLQEILDDMDEENAARSYGGYK